MNAAGLIPSMGIEKEGVPEWGGKGVCQKLNALLGIHQGKVRGERGRW